MYINIGGDYVVRDKNIVGIMDIENTSTSKITREYFRKIGKSVITISDDLPRSFVITNENGEDKVYLSPISSHTLFKRADKRK